MPFDEIPNSTAAHWLVQALTSRQIYEVIRHSPFTCQQLAAGGFKLTPEKAGRSVVRKRLERLVAREETLMTALLGHPETPWQKWHRFLSALDEGWMREHIWALLRLDDIAPFAAAGLAIDLRPWPSRLGRHLLRRGSFWSAEPTPGKVAALPAEKLPCGLDVFPELLQEGVAAGSETNAPPPTPGDGKRLVNENRVLRSSLERQKEKVRSCEKQLKEMEAVQQDAQAKTRQQLQEVLAQNEELKRDFDIQMRKRTDEMRRKLLGPPPGAPRALPDRSGLDADTTSTDDLIEEARRQLRHQARQDERYGRRAAVREELRNLERTHAELTACMNESLHVRHGLTEVRELIAQRIERLRAVLETPERREEKPPLAESMLVEIDGAACDETGLQELDELRTILGRRCVRSVLGTHWSKYVHKVIQRKRNEVVTVIAERGRLLPESKPVQTASSGEILTVDYLADQLARSVTVCLFVDACNVVLAVDDLSRRVDSGSMTEAVEHLGDLCRHLPSNCRVELVADGQDTVTQREQAADNVAVVYVARQKESQNADNYIVDQILAQQGSGGERIWLSTGDRGLRERIARLIDAVVDVHTFYQYLIR